MDIQFREQWYDNTNLRACETDEITHKFELITRELFFQNQTALNYLYFFEHKTRTRMIAQRPRSLYKKYSRTLHTNRNNVPTSSLNITNDNSIKTTSKQCRSAQFSHFRKIFKNSTWAWQLATFFSGGNSWRQTIRKRNSKCETPSPRYTHDEPEWYMARKSISWSSDNAWECIVLTIHSVHNLNELINIQFCLINIIWTRKQNLRKYY